MQGLHQSDPEKISRRFLLLFFACSKEFSKDSNELVGENPRIKTIDNTVKMLFFIIGDLLFHSERSIVMINYIP